MYLKEKQTEHQIRRILSSDLRRAATTAELISSGLGLPVHPDPRLRETNNGDLAGMANEIALERYPGLFFSSLGMDEAYPNGESPRDFFRRVRNWFEDFRSAARPEDGNTLAVTHGGVINVVYHLALDIPWSNRSPAFPCDHASLHALDLDRMEFAKKNLVP